MRLTESEFKQIQALRKAKAPQPKQIVKQKVRGEMNKTEQRFEQDYLKPLTHIGTFKDYEYESVKLKLGNGTYYTPDFCAWHPNGSVTFFEVKGAYIRDKGAMTIKIAASKYPLFKFVLAQYSKGQWTEQEMKA